MDIFYYSSSKYMKLHKVVKTDKLLGKYHQKWEYLRVLSWDLQVFIEINTYIFVVIRSKVSNMQTKKKIHAWADLDPRPHPLITCVDYLTTPNGTSYHKVRRKVKMF